MKFRRKNQLQIVCPHCEKQQWLCIRKTICLEIGFDFSELYYDEESKTAKPSPSHEHYTSDMMDGYGEVHPPVDMDLGGIMREINGYDMEAQLDYDPQAINWLEMHGKFYQDCVQCNNTIYEFEGTSITEEDIITNIMKKYGDREPDIFADLEIDNGVVQVSREELIDLDD